jgi:tripartite-type tricarboxylate transporter receptor subunit TctC
MLQTETVAGMGMEEARLRKESILDFSEMKEAARKVAWLPGYDFPTAQLAEKAGTGMQLVGDSMGMCFYGYAGGTMPVITDQCIVHSEAVRRGRQMHASWIPVSRLKPNKEEMMGTMNKATRIVGLFCLLSVCFFIKVPDASPAEEKYPTRTIKLVVPISAGGPTDVIARKVADVVGKSLGQEVIIENKPGAGGLVGATYVVRSKPDGYTIGFMTSGSYLISPFFTKMDFDPMTDPVPIVQALTISHWIYVKDDSPIKTFNDVIELGRKRQLLVGSVGMLLGDFALERIAAQAKLNLKIMPLGGGPGINAALLGGQVDAGVSSVQSEYIRSGKERLIARVTEGPVLPEYKDVPQVNKFGYDLVTPGFIVFFGPKGLPKHIHAKLEEEFSRALANPSVIETIKKIGEMPTVRGSADFNNFIKVEHARVEKMMKELGVGIFAKEKK